MKKIVVVCGLLAMGSLIIVKNLFTTEPSADAKVSNPVVLAKATPVAAPLKVTPVAQAKTVPPSQTQMVDVPIGNVLFAPKVVPADPQKEPAFAAFAGWTEKYMNADDSARAQLEAEGVRLAQQRRAALKDLMVADAKRALELAVSYYVRSAMPEGVVEQLEQRLSGRGYFESGYGIGSRGCGRMYSAEMNGQYYTAFTYGARADKESRQNVAMNGIAVDQSFAMNETPYRIMEPAEAAAVVTVAKRTGVQLARDSAAQPAAPGGEVIVVEVDGAPMIVSGAKSLDTLSANLTLQESAMTTLGDVKHTGNNRHLILRCEYSGGGGLHYRNSSTSVPLSDFNMVADQCSSFIRANSYGQAWYGARTDSDTTKSVVSAVITLPHSKSYYQSNGKSAIKADAFGLYPDHVNFDVVSICFDYIVWSPSIWYGYTPSGQEHYSFINGCYSSVIMVHEHGHLFGANHAGSYSLVSGVKNAMGSYCDPFNLTDGDFETYGDPFDVMGHPCVVNLNPDSNDDGHQHYSALRKNQIGWLPDGKVQTYDLTTTTWQGRIGAADNSKARDNYGTLAVKIHKKSTDGDSHPIDYWVQLRQLFTDNKWMQNGLHLYCKRTVSDSTHGNCSTLLLDATPNSQSSDLQDSPLVLGKTYGDTCDNIYITPTAIGTDAKGIMWADVTVHVGTTGQDPTFNLSQNPDFGGKNCDVTLTADTGGATGLSYFWEFAENDASAFDKSFKSVNSSSITHAWTSTGPRAYRVTVSDMKGGVTTKTGLITIDTRACSGGIAPVITQALPASTTVTSGTTPTFSIVATGSPAPSYTWTFKGINQGVNASSCTLQSADVTAGTWTLKVVADNNVDPNASSSCAVLVQDPITSSITPDSNVNAGTSSFVITASVSQGSAPFTYKWYHGTTLVQTTTSTSSTTSTYTLNNVSLSDAGLYKCIVNNQVDTNTDSMTLTVNATAVSVNGPVQGDSTQNITSNVVFSVTTTGGTAPLSYQWKYNDTTAIPWGTSSSITLTNIQMTNDGSYKCIVTDSLGTVGTSSNAYLKVYWPVAITGDLVSRTNNVGDNANFSVTAVGTNLTYTWYSNSTVIANQTTSNLNLAVDTNLLGVNYKVVVGCSDPFYATNTATSAVATVSILYPAWTNLVQWNMNSPAPDGNVSTGTSNNSYSLTAPAGINTNYSNLKSNYLAGSTSDPALSDNSAFGYTNNWPAVTGPNRTNGIEFRVSTLGYTNIVVTWEQRNSAQASKYWRLIYMTNGLAGNTNVATMHMVGVSNQFVYFSSDLSGKANVNNNTNLVIRIASEWENTATGSGNAGFVGTQGGTYATTGTVHFDMVGIWGKPQGITITGQPLSVTKAVADNHTFTVTATGLNPQYQWRSNTVPIVGATTSALTLNNIQLNYAASYDCKVTNVINSVTSSVAVLTVLAPPAITTQPQSQTNYTTLASVFTVSATGGGTLTYQWQKNGSAISNGGPISGATTPSLTLGNLQTTDVGSYTVVVANAAGSTTSSPAAVLTVSPIPTDWYWSLDRAAQGGGGNWGTANINWGFSPGGPYDYVWQNTNIVSAHFGGTGGNVTLTNGVTVNKIFFESAGYSILGTSNLTFSGVDAGADVPGANNSSTTNTVSITCPISGPVFVKTGGGRLHLHDTANAIGKWIIKGGVVDAQGRSKFFGTPTLPSLVSDFITLDGGGFGLVIGGTGWALNANDGIYLGPNGGQIGVDNASIAMVLNEPITGPGSLSFPDTNSWPGQTLGKAGSFTLVNQENDYDGSTTVEVGTLILSKPEVLPDSTTLNITKNGRVDLSDNYETVSALVLDGPGATLTNGTLNARSFDLRQGGPIDASLEGPGRLTKTTANNVTFNSCNSYLGDTTLSAGTITINNSRCAFGGGTLNLAGGGIILSQTLDTNSVQYNPVVMSADTTIQNGDTGANTIQWLHDASWSGTAGTLSIRNTNSAPGGSFDVLLGNSFTFSRPIAIGASGDMPTQLTSYNTNGCSQTFSGNISGVGSFRRSVVDDGVTLPGRTVLMGANTYSGGTIVEAGTLAVNNSTGSGVGTGTVTVSALGNLVGTGTIGGNVVVNSGAIGAGDGVGVLTLSNGLNLSSGGTNVWELNILNDDIGATEV